MKRPLLLLAVVAIIALTNALPLQAVLQPPAAAGVPAAQVSGRRDDRMNAAPAKPASAGVAGALGWLSGQQSVSGAWNAASDELAVRDTAAAVAAYAAYGDHGTAFSKGAGWLAGRTTATDDPLARELIALGPLGMGGTSQYNALAARQLADGSWGATSNAVEGNAFDTALALLAMSSQPPVAGAQKGLAYLTSRQSAGGWALSPGVNSVQATATALLALAAYQDTYNLSAAMAAAAGYLQGKQYGSGAYGDASPGTADETALAHLALWAARAPNPAALASARAYLLGAQGGDGSWGGNVYATALAARALAQADATRVTGRVVDASASQPLSNSTVSLVGIAGVTAMTSISGSFTLQDVPPGARQVSATLGGYGSVTTSTVAVAGQSVNAGTLNLSETGPSVSFHVALPVPESTQYTVFQPTYFTPTVTAAPGTSIVEWMWSVSTGVQGNYPFAYVYPVFFPDNGTYTVTLSARDNLGRVGTYAQALNVVNLPPVVTAGADVTGIVGMPVLFGPLDNPNIFYVSDASSVDGNYGFGIHWDFGVPNASSILLGTGWTYDTPGVYTATLTAADKDGGVGSATRRVTILPGGAPTAAFAAPAGINAYSAVTFHDSSIAGDIGGVQRWHWDFGDGTSTGLKNPVHFYYDPGTYSVTLTVSDTNGLASTVMHPFSVNDVAPTIAFTGPLTVATGSVISFTGLISDVSPAADAGLSIAWDFGDGGNSTQREPTHSWAAAGAYAVSVSALDPAGSRTAVTTTLYAVNGYTPTAQVNNYYGGPTPFLVVHNGSILFTACNPVPCSTLPLERRWYLDGALQLDQNPADPYGYYTFPAFTLGLHTVTLDVVYPTGTARASHIISVYPTPYAPVAGSVVTTTVGLQLPYLYFIGGVPSLIDWGDGTSTVDNTYGYGAPHLYPRTGTYHTLFYGANTDGMEIPPVASTVSVITPVTPIVDFVLSTYFQYCGQIPPHEGDMCGFQPDIAFSNPPRPSYSPDGSAFTKSVWRWGDGTANTIQNGLADTTHLFANWGNYTVTLWAQTATGLTATVTRPVTVTNVAPTASAGISRTVPSGLPQTVEGSGRDVGPYDQQRLQFRWDFGDGSGSVNAQYADPAFAYERHTWNAAGIYTVTVVVTDAGGLTGTAFARYTVISNHPPVVHSTAPNLGVVGQNYVYQVGATDPDGDPLTYALALAPAGMAVSASGLIQWTPAPTQTGFNEVKLIVSDPYSATTPHIFGVTVSDQPFTADLVPISVAAGLSTDAQALTASGTASVTVKNFGYLTATAPFSVTFFDDTNEDGQYTAGVDTVLGVATVNEDLPGNAQTLVTAPVAGSVLFRDNLVWAFVDSGNVVPEGAREDNNVRSSGDSSRYVPPPGVFAPQLKWAWRGSDVHPDAGNGGKWSNVINAPMVAPLVDTNGDGKIDGKDVPAIVFESITDDTSNGGTTMLRAIRGDNGAAICDTTAPGTTPAYSAGPGGYLPSEVAIGDLDGDGKPEIITFVGFEYIQARAYNNDCTVRWTSAVVPNTGFVTPRGGATLADLDGNGKLSVILGNMVWNYDGTLRWQGTPLRGVGAFNNCCSATVADLNLDGKPEIIAGRTAYRADGSVLWDFPIPPGPYGGTDDGDGWAAVANFNGDPYPEVALVSQIYRGPPTTDIEVRLLNHDGTLRWGPVVFPEQGGGPPLLADVNGDGIPDIGIAGRSFYFMLNGKDGSVLWQRPTQDLSSAETGSSAFDFDGDGKFEIVYGDELFVRIFRGSDGAVLWQAPNPNGTFLEYPTIADIDHDGHAEILVPRNQVDPTLGQQLGLTDGGGVFIYGDTFNNWRPARSVWNEHSYHITNVSDDGKVPSHEANSWQKYNTFRAQVPPDGMDPFAAPDLTASRLMLDAGSCPSGLDFILRAGNGGSLLSPPGVAVSFYDGVYDHAHLLATTTITRSILPGHFVDVTAHIANPPTGAHAILAFVDDALAGAFQVPEGREDNNAHGRTLTLCGPDQPPAFTSGPLLSAIAGQTYAYNATASDPDADPLSFSLDAGPAGLSIVPANGAVRWVPTLAQLGAQPVALRVADGRGGTATQTFSVNVTLPPVGTPPPLCTIPNGTPGNPEILGDGIDNDCNPETVDTIPGGALGASINPDRRSYASHQQARLLSTVTRDGSAGTFESLVAIVTVQNAGSQTLFTAQHALGAIPPNAHFSFDDEFDTGTQPPGNFTARVDVQTASGSFPARAPARPSGTPLAGDSKPFAISASDALGKALSGTLALTPTNLSSGDPITVSWNAANIGNTSLTSVTLLLMPVIPTTTQVLSSYQEVASFALGQMLTRTTVFNSSNFGGGNRLFVLLGISDGVTQTLASGGVVIDSVPTSVTVASFSAKPDVQGVAIQWVTALELGVRGYQVERSTNGITYTAVSTITLASGIGTYAVRDNDPPPAGTIVYYRLVEIYFNNRTKLYGPVKVTIPFWQFLPVVKR